MLRWRTKMHCYYNLFATMDSSNVSDYLFDLGCGPSYISNNTFYEAKQVIKFTTDSATYVYNNIFSNVGSAFGGSLKTTETDYNLYYNTTDGDGEEHSILNKDPLFVDSENGDFQLQSGSPCLNVGKVLGFTEDINGTSVFSGEAPEIGAYEYASTDSIPPTALTGLNVNDITCSSFVLNWNEAIDNVEVIGYLIYKNGEYYKFTQDTSISIIDLNYGTDYSMSVRAKDSNGNLSDSSEIIVVSTLVPDDTEAPDTPTGLNVSRYGQTNFTLEWNTAYDNEGVREYDIYVDGSLFCSVSDTTCIITGLSAGVTYSVAVKARDFVNNVSEESVALSATTIPECVNTPGWENNSISEQNGRFSVEFDVVPNGDNMYGVVGLSNGTVWGYSDLACMLKFNDSGYIEAINSDNYSSDEDIPYYANMVYHVKLDISLDNHTYDIYVTPEGEERVMLGLDYSFRSGQSSISEINNYATYCLSCSLSVTNFSCNYSTGNNPINETNGFVIYPVPVKNTISLETKIEGKLNIIDISGKIVFSQTIKRGGSNIQLNIISGIYTAQLIGNDNSVCTKKLIVE